jgi:hypothetical protein
MTLTANILTANIHDNRRMKTVPLAEILIHPLQSYGVVSKQSSVTDDYSIALLT